MREIPKGNRLILKAARMDLLEMPLASSSGLKPDVQRRLDEIAMATLAEIRVVNPTGPTAGVSAAGEVLGKAGVHPDPTAPPALGRGSEMDGKAEKRQSGSSGHGGGGSSKVSPSKMGNSSEAVDKAPSTGPSSASRKLTSNSVGFGLESERLCEVVISGSLESIELAKVRVLVMFDELVSLLLLASGSR